MKSFYFLSVMICVFVTCFSVHTVEQSGRRMQHNLEVLCTACCHEDAKYVEEVLKNFEGDVNGKSELHRISNHGVIAYATTPLGYGAQRGDAAMMSVLLAYGAKAPGIALYKLASSVVGEKFDACFKLLIDHGVDVNASCNFYDNTPLHVSLPENIKKLVYAGADMEIKNEEKQTPLYKHIFEVGGRKEESFKCFKKLLKYGAPIDEYYKNPIDIRKPYTLLTRGEICKKPSQRIDSLVVLAFKALGEKVCTIIQDTTLISAINPCLETYVACLVEKKVCEVEKYIQHHCPKIGLKPASMAGFMKLISLYANEEATYKKDDRINCLPSDRWDTAEKKAKDLEFYVYERKVYLEKRLSKAVGQKDLYKKLHANEYVQRKALGKK